MGLGSVRSLVNISIFGTLFASDEIEVLGISWEIVLTSVLERLALDVTFWEICSILTGEDSEGHGCVSCKFSFTLGFELEISTDTFLKNFETDGNNLVLRSSSALCFLLLAPLSNLFLTGFIFRYYKWRLSTIQNQIIH